MNIELLGINVSTEPKSEIIRNIEKRIDKGQKTFIVTPYSEFFYRGFLDYWFKHVLNKADISLPDGIAVLWLSYFLNIPLKAKGYYAKIAEVTWQAIYSLSSIILNPAKLKRIIPDKISGSDFFWDLVSVGIKKNLKIFLLGGYQNTPELVAKKILERFPNSIIAGTSNSNPTDHNLVEQINSSGADILFVAFGPGKQENWIAKNLELLQLKVVMAVGGTFDYVAGKHPVPPKFVRSGGLEWLFRLITQPHRYRRIGNATFGLVIGAIRQKIFISLPFRPNVVGVIINKEGKILVVQRTSDARAVAENSLNPAREEHWQFPQGGVDLNEDSSLAVLREMREELGLENLVVLGKASKKNNYLWNHTIRPLFFNSFHYKGQSQEIYFIKYEGSIDAITLEEKELSEYKWIEIEQVEKVLHYFRRDLAKIVTSEIGKYYVK